MQEILQYLKNHGERLDSEIAAATGLSLAHVRRGMTDLSAKGDVMMCRSIRFKDGKQIEGMSCRERNRAVLRAVVLSGAVCRTAPLAPCQPGIGL
jgi:DNA-binding IclR family transcriptional regulator